jgi:hypothetical protein
VEVHLKGDERKQQTVCDQEHAHNTIQPTAWKHHRREERGDAHEAVAKDVDGVKERIERCEEKRLDALRSTRNDSRRNPSELHEVVDADQKGVIS